MTTNQKRCEPCRATGLSHCSDPENCGGPWDKRNDPPDAFMDQPSNEREQVAMRRIHSEQLKRAKGRP